MLKYRGKHLVRAGFIGVALIVMVITVGLQPQRLLTWATSLRHQALFIGYAPADNPKIAVVVVVEHGGYGASTAGPIARKMMDAYLLPKTEQVVLETAND